MSERSSVARRTLIFATAYALVVMIQRGAEVSTLGVFLQQVGADKLPWGLLVVAAVDVPLTWVYRSVVRSRDTTIAFRWVICALLVALASTTALYPVFPSVSALSSYVVASVGGTFLSIQWGVVLLDGYTTVESRRAFPWIYASGHAGAFVVGGMMSAWGGDMAVRPWLSVVPLVGAFLGVWSLTASGMRAWGATMKGQTLLPASGDWTDEPDRFSVFELEVGRKFRSLVRLPLVQSMAASTFLMVLIRQVLRVLYGEGLEQSRQLGQSIVSVLGWYTMAASVVGLGLQLLVTPAALKRLGVGRLNLVYGVSVLAAMVGFGVGISTISGMGMVVISTFGRFVDLEFKAAVKTPLSVMFYQGLFERDRAPARALVLGVVSPVAAVVGSLLVLAGLDEGGVRLLAAAGSVGAVLYTAACWWQARVYRRGLERQLVHWASRMLGQNCSVRNALSLAVSDDNHDPYVRDLAHSLLRETSRWSRTSHV